MDRHLRSTGRGPSREFWNSWMFPLAKKSPKKVPLGHSMKEAANIYQPHSHWNPKSNNNLLQPLLYIIYPTSLNQNETGTIDAISKWSAISYRTIYLEHMVLTLDFVYCVYTKHISGSKYSYFDPPVVFETSRTTCSSPSKTNGHSSCPHDVINCDASVRSCQCRGRAGRSPVSYDIVVTVAIRHGFDSIILMWAHHLLNFEVMTQSGRQGCFRWQTNLSRKVQIQYRDNHRVSSHFFIKPI